MFFDHNVYWVGLCSEILCNYTDEIFSKTFSRYSSTLLPGGSVTPGALMTVSSFVRTFVRSFVLLLLFFVRSFFRCSHVHSFIFLLSERQ